MTDDWDIDDWDRIHLGERVRLQPEAFARAFDEFRRREQGAGRTITLAALGEKVGINERMFRKARTQAASLPRHQVEKIAELIGCSPESIAETVRKKQPSPWDEQDKQNERDRAAWPVPLREVASWVEFVKLLVKADCVRPRWNDDVLSLTAAPAVDAFSTALRHSSQVAKDNPAIAAATLKDAADDLRALDLHVLAGRYLARRRVNEPDNPSPYGSWVELVYVLEVWIRREIEDLAHVVDRSNECWLAWEGKRRLFLWG